MLSIYPHLTNRKIEDNADAKNIWTQPITIRMESLPSNKPVPINFHGWVMMDDNEPDRNVFARCPLVIDRRPQHVIAFGSSPDLKPNFCYKNDFML